MQLTVLREAGYEEALLGLSLSFLAPIEKMPEVAVRLAKKGEPHSKFLRQISVWLDITASWLWFKQLSTYKVGVEQQSTSTMHKLLSRKLLQDDFSVPISPYFLETINMHIVRGDLEAAVAHLPGAYLYRRIVCTNYTALRNIIRQRKGHKLGEWAEFIEQLTSQLRHQEFL